MFQVDMKILFLGYADTPLLKFLRQQTGVRVDQTSEKLSLAAVVKENYDLLISYGYRYILKKELLDRFPNRAINLHISYLPWNRGADPNLWSFLEDTPKGVTIHLIDEGIDTGDILFQKRVNFSENETLSSSYQKLRSEIESLFIENWKQIKTFSWTPQPQKGEGSAHQRKDKEAYASFLGQRWDTPVDQLVGKASVRSIR